METIRELEWQGVEGEQHSNDNRRRILTNRPALGPLIHTVSDKILYSRTPTISLYAMRVCILFPRREAKRDGLGTAGFKCSGRPVRGGSIADCLHGSAQLKKIRAHLPPQRRKGPRIEVSERDSSSSGCRKGWLKRVGRLGRLER